MRTGRLLPMLYVFVSLLSYMTMNATSPKQPDFAYPKTVSAQSEKNLTAAMRTSDYPGVVRSLMDYYLAQVSIDSDKSSAALEKIKDVCAKEKDETLKSLLYLLQADIYLDIYQNNRWKYDERSVPLTPLPNDYNLWSGEQFRTEISALIDSSLTYSAAIKDVPLKKYASVINSDTQTFVYYPSVYDFVATKSIRILSSLSTHRRVFSWGLLVPNDVYLSAPFPKSDPIANRILQLYASLLQANKGRVAAEINTDISRIGFIYNRIYQTGSHSDASGKLMALLRPLYEDNKLSEYSGDVLEYIGSNCSDADPKWLYNAIEHNLAAFPAYRGKNCLLNIKNELSQKNVRIMTPWVVAPGEPVKLEVKLSNIKSVNINIYDVSSLPVYRDNVVLKDMPSRRKVATLTASVDGVVPFSGQTTVEYAFPSAGNYIIVPEVNGKEQIDRSYTKVHVTHYTLGASVFKENKIWVMDAKTGAPVSDANITIYNNVYAYRKQPKAVSVGKTGADGSKVYDVSGEAVVEKDGDKYAMSLYVSNNNFRPQDKWQPSAVGFPALPLYHPGDTVEWTAVCYEFMNSAQRPRRNVEITAVMHGASYEPIDTLKLVTDPYGRVNGTFAIPKECLTGHFMISIDEYSSAVGFEVSDYKLPTFRVQLDPVEKNYPSKGDVTLIGRVVTYSGFPLADSKVTADISVAERMRWWWNRSKGISFTSKEVTTGSDGKFELTVDAAELATSPLPEGVFTANISVLSASGETQTSSITFVTGTKYDIRASLPEAIEVSGSATPIDVKVVNYQDSVINMPVKYEIMQDSVAVLKGVMTANNRTLDLSSLPSGRYEFRFSLEDESLADKCDAYTVIYRNSDKKTPVPGTLLWYPNAKVSVKHNGKGSWRYAVDCDTHLLLTLWSKDEVIYQKWEKASAGMHTLEVELPDGIDDATLSVSATGNYRSSSITLAVKRLDVAKGIKFITESFRDKLVPGSEETWTFKVVDGSGNGKQAAVILDMYNTALDALAKTNWNLKFYGGTSRFYIWNQGSLGQTFDSYFSFDSYKYKNCQSLIAPDFNTYNMSFADGAIGYRVMNEMKMSRAGGPMIRGVNATYKMSSAVVDTADAVEEHAEEVMVTEGDMDSGSLGNSMAEPAVSGSVGDDDALEGSSKPEFTYRDAETPLAFFAPQLVTGADGSLSFTFNVPNANTTWGFRALAYTDSLLSTNFTADVLANKPVMVQPNLPRYLRAGDKVVISAMVMNGSDEEQNVETTVELFNPADGAVFGNAVSSDTLAPNATAVVDYSLTAPSDVPFVGYRVKSTSGRFTDGEQTLLPILPAITPVIETYPFYISPDSAEFSMSIPKAPADARVTLQFCENPTWYVVTALPGILQLEPSTANEAAASIFSAAIASGLMRDNPMIAKALKEWESSDKSDGMLKSMLERNEDLKIVLLSATPWMLDAKSDTERMTRLALLFDKKTIDRTYSSAISLLKRLERDGGGWAWYAQCDEPSQWATENVLLMMGRLRSLGFLPENKELKKMILNSIGYLDREVASQYRKYPSAADFTTYIYMRDYFKGFTATGGASQAISATVQRILKRWKAGSPFDKAIDARILANHGYKNVAKTVIASLREFAQSTPEKGMWWASLDNMTLWSMGKVGTTALILEAFAAVEPGCKDIDMIRQWLILQKEAKDWGTSVTTSAVIAAILSTSKSWIAPAQGSKVYVGATEVVPESVERLTGYFRTPLAAESTASGELKVVKDGDTPSWGALYYQYIDSMANVKSASSGAVSIEKTIYKVDQTSTGAKTVAPESLNVGDKVKVQLTIKVDRDMDYVAVIDDRPACYEPVEQLPEPIVAEGIYFYRENRDSSTRFFITHLPKGTYLLTYDMWVNNAGSFTSGIATIQSQYAPQMSAHSSGNVVLVQK